VKLTPVACLSPADAHAQNGYATPLAMASCLVIAMTVGGLTAASIAQLRLARNDLGKLTAEYALAGEQLAAAHRLAVGGAGTRLQWLQDAPQGGVEVLAEAEAAKANFETARRWPQVVRSAIGFSEPGDLGAGHSLCGGSVVSAYGMADYPELPDALPPSDSGGGSAQPGELWRIRVSGAGWVDDRVVRLTGHAARPAATIERRFYRGERIGDRCDEALQAVQTSR